MNRFARKRFFVVTTGSHDAFASYVLNYVNAKVGISILFLV